MGAMRGYGGATECVTLMKRSAQPLQMQGKEKKKQIQAIIPGTDVVLVSSMQKLGVEGNVLIVESKMWMPWSPGSGVWICICQIIVLLIRMTGHMPRNSLVMLSQR